MFKNEIAKINDHDSETARMTSKAIKQALFENKPSIAKSLIEGFNEYQKALEFSQVEQQQKIKAAQAFYLNY